MHVYNTYVCKFCINELQNMSQSLSNSFVGDFDAKNQESSQQLVDSDFELCDGFSLPIEEDEESDCEFCLISLPVDMPLDTLNNVEFDLNQTEAVQTFDFKYQCIHDIEKQEVNKAFLRAKVETINNEETKLLTRNLRKYVKITKTLPFDTTNSKLFLPKPQPPLIPVNVKRRNMLFGSNSLYPRMADDIISLQKRPKKKKKRSSKENVTASMKSSIDATVEMNDTIASDIVLTDSSTKRHKKKRKRNLSVTETNAEHKPSKESDNNIEKIKKSKKKKHKKKSKQMEDFS